MVSIFYFIGLFMLLLNIVLMTMSSNIVYLREFVLKFEKVTNKKPEKNDFSGKLYETYTYVKVVELSNFIWFFVGLISSNWIIFLMYFIYNLLISILLINGNIKWVNISIEFLRHLMNVALLAILVFNHFHFKLNLTNLFLSFF